MTTPSMPQPELESKKITLEQYHAYSPEKIELIDGLYGFCYYKEEIIKGFYLAMLTNMGLKKAIRYLPLSSWLEAIQTIASNDPKLNFDDEVSEAMLNRFNRGLADLQVVASYLEEK